MRDKKSNGKHESRKWAKKSGHSRGRFLLDRIALPPTVGRQVLILVDVEGAEYLC